MEIREKCRSSGLYALVDYRERASLRTLWRSYEKPASRCTGDLCSFFPLLIWLFSSFPTLPRYMSLPPPIDSSLQLCVRVLVAQTDLARCQKQKSFCTYLPVIRGDRMTESAERVQWLRIHKLSPNQIGFVQWIIQYARKRHTQKQIIPTSCANTYYTSPITRVIDCWYWLFLYKPTINPR